MQAANDNDIFYAMPRYTLKWTDAFGNYYEDHFVTMQQVEDYLKGLVYTKAKIDNYYRTH